MHRHTPTNRTLRKCRRVLGKISLSLACFLLLFVMLAVLRRPNERPDALLTSDYWVHATAVKNVASIVQSGAPFESSLAPLTYRHKRPYYLALGFFSAVSGLSPLTVLLLAGLFNVLLLAAGIALFARRFVSSRAPAGLFLFTALLFWGRGFFHSNEYQLSALPVMASYPSTFCFALSLLALPAYGRLCSNRHKNRVAVWGDLVLVMLLGAEVLLEHPRTFFSFFLPTAGLAALFFARSRTGKLLALLTPIPLFLLTAVWPWCGELYGATFRLAGDLLATEMAKEESAASGLEETALLSEDGKHSEDEAEAPARAGAQSERRSPSLIKTYNKHYTYKEIKRRAPAVLFGFPMVLLLLPRRNRKARFIAAAALLCLGLWAICGYVLGTTIGYRWLYFYGFFMQVAAARLIWEFAAHRKWWPVSLVILAAVLMVGWDCGRHAVRLHIERTSVRLPYDDLDRIAALTAWDRVLAGPRASHYMGAFGIRPAWAGRPLLTPPLAAIARWLENPTGETLLQAARARDAKWFLADKEEGPPAISTQSGALERALETPRYVLYRIAPAGPIEPIGPISRTKSAVPVTADSFNF